VYKRFIIPGIFFVLALLLFAGSSDTRILRANWLSQTIFLPFVKTIQAYNTVQELKQENFVLQNKLTLQALENLELKNYLKALQQMQNFHLEFSDVPFTLAEVVGFSGQFHDRNLIINKGSADGVEFDSPVVSADGIIGKVVVVNNANSIVLPLNHSQFQLAVMDKSTNVQGILQSDLTGNTYMNLIKLGSQISIGDTVVTSNLSRLFPKGYPVGKISRIKESQDNLFLSAQIVPFTFVENLEHVFVLKKSFVKKLLQPIQITTVPDTTRIIDETGTQPVN
jgi:rod shape-determining protein MreC